MQPDFFPLGDMAGLGALEAPTDKLAEVEAKGEGVTAMERETETVMERETEAGMERETEAVLLPVATGEGLGGEDVEPVIEPRVQVTLALLATGLHVTLPWKPEQNRNNLTLL